MGEERARTTTTKALVKAVTGPINMAVVSAAAVGAVAMHSWPVVALGGVAYAALVAWDLVSGNDKEGAPRARRPALPDPGKLKDQATRASVSAIACARTELLRVLKGTSQEVKNNLALALASAEELVERAALLAKRSEELGEYLAKIDARTLEKDVANLHQRVAAAKDAEAKEQYETARRARAEHLAVIVELGNTKERVNASLVGIAATLEGLPAKVVRMRTLDAAAMDELSGSLKEDLDRMNGELTSLEEALSSLAEAGREMRSS